MSVICIVSHNESIYESTKPPVSYHTRKPNFMSQFRRNEQKLQKQTSKKHQGMGLPETEPPDPKAFLKKGSRKPPEVNVEKRPERSSRLPPVPKKEECLNEQDEKLKHKRKDFITKNSRRARAMDVPEATTKGKFAPTHLETGKYGKSPNYLSKLIKAREKNMQTQKDIVGLHQPVCKYITRDEREQLLEGLKLNWEELQKQYQGLPIMTDTIPKILRKSKLEAELKQLEKDIVLLERHPYIYVYDDEDLTPPKTK